MQKKDLLRKRRHLKIRAKLSGTASRPRLVVFRSLNGTSAQLIDDTSGKTLIASCDIKITKGTKTERAIEVGKMLAQKALEQKIDQCVFDRNGYKYHGRVKALADAARGGGANFLTTHKKPFPKHTKKPNTTTKTNVKT